MKTIPEIIAEIEKLIEDARKREYRANGQNQHDRWIQEHCRRLAYLEILEFIEKPSAGE
jgi:hypothetical protein